MSVPLLVTHRGAVADELSRISAAAQVDIHTTTPALSRTLWRSAPLVVVDAAAVAELAAHTLPRRDGVLVVTLDHDDVVDWADCLRLGASSTAVLGEADEALVAALTDAVEPGSGDGRVLAVLGAAGGVGTSLFAVALAMAGAAAGRRVLLADCDPLGSGLDLTLGLEDRPGTRWESLSAPAGRLPVGALHRSLPGPRTPEGRISLLCHERRRPVPLAAATVDVLLRSVRRTGDLMVADLPRHSEPGTDLLADSADAVVLLTTADLRGACAAGRAAERLAGAGVTAGLVVRGPSPGGLGAAEIADVVGLPLWCAMRPEPSAARWVEAGGLPPARRRGALLTAARSVLTRVGGGAAA